MEAGRELDALVAEAFGLPSDDYSTDISVAWEVAEAMFAQGWLLEMLSDEDSSDVEFFRLGQDIRPMYSHEDERVEVAICVAALRAVGVECE